MRAVDKLIAGYVVFVTAVIVLRGGLATPANWWLLGMHGLIGLLLYLFTRLGPDARAGRFLHDVYPLILLVPLYGEIGVLSVQLGVDSTFARDAIVQRWEATLFGGQVSHDWIRRAPSVFWSGLLHLAYFAYYPIVTLGPILLIVRGRRSAARRVLLATMLAFVMCYVIFVLFPVAGPNYAFPHPTGAVRDVWSARLVYAVLAGGSSFGAAFPSSHVAATLASVGALAREWRGLAAGFALPALLLTLGTVYCQMHYAVDALSGVAVGALSVWAGTKLAASEHPAEERRHDPSPPHAA